MAMDLDIGSRHADGLLPLLPLLLLLLVLLLVAC